jgi:hypothetical protein
MILNIFKKIFIKNKIIYDKPHSPQKIYLEVPYSEKEFAKKLGAKWDFIKKTWFIYSDIDNTSFIRWHPSYKIKLKAQYFYLAQSIYPCYKCDTPTQVNAIVLPSGFYTLDYDTIETRKQQNFLPDNMPFCIQNYVIILSYIYYISNEALTAIQKYTNHYNKKYSHTINSSYYRSSCLKCFAAHGDNSLIHEFNTPFFPVDSNNFSKIKFIKINKPILLNSGYTEYPNFYDLSFEDVLNISNKIK